MNGLEAGRRLGRIRATCVVYNAVSPEVLTSFSPTIGLQVVLPLCKTPVYHANTGTFQRPIGVGTCCELAKHRLGIGYRSVVHVDDIYQVINISYRQFRCTYLHLNCRVVQLEKLAP